MPDEVIRPCGRGVGLRANGCTQVGARPYPEAERKLSASDRASQLRVSDPNLQVGGEGARLALRHVGF